MRGYIGYLYLPYEYNIEELLNRSMNEDKKRYKKVVKKEELKNIMKNIKYKKELNNIEKICPIGQREFIEDEEISELNCGHYFDKNAIEKWLTTESNICPLCRKEYDYIEIENN